MGIDVDHDAVCAVQSIVPMYHRRVNFRSFLSLSSDSDTIMWRDTEVAQSQNSYRLHDRQL